MNARSPCATSGAPRGRDERQGFLRFVVLAAIGGVAVGTGALLLALMIVRGFSREIEAKIVGFGQHVQVESFLGDPLADTDSLQAAIAAIPGVVRVAPSVVDFALVSARGGGASGVDGVLLWGTRPEDLPFVVERTEIGAFSFAPDAAGRPGLVVGARLAERLGLSVGDRVTAYSTRELGAGQFQSRPRLHQYHLAGVFETGLGDFDDRFAFSSLSDARDLFAYAPDQVSRLDLTLEDRRQARAVAGAITDEIGPPLFARPIEDVYRGLFAWVELQQSIVPLVISILVIVSAFNIIGALLMVVLEKAREIGDGAGDGRQPAGGAGAVRGVRADGGRDRRGAGHVGGPGAGGDPAALGRDRAAPGRLLPGPGTHRDLGPGHRGHCYCNRRVVYPRRLHPCPRGLRHPTDSHHPIRRVEGKRAEAAEAPSPREPAQKGPSGGGLSTRP